LKVVINGIEPELFDLEDDFQTIISTDPLVLEIHPGRIDSSELKDRMPFLRSRTFVQSDDPRIMKAASEITSNSSTNEFIANDIGKWVFDNIEKDYVISMPSAIDVLEIKKGDCNEHTSLYTALARASGLPTKICIGIVYKDGRFYYHAWPAVYLGGWRPLDPTFGQDVADAAHIKFLEGGFERQANLLRMVGRVSVTILATSENMKEQL
jgi:transglutaminase-like putative cysteine protease